jgi:hypothetical protein
MGGGNEESGYSYIKSLIKGYEREKKGWDTLLWFPFIAGSMQIKVKVD